MLSAVDEAATCGAWTAVDAVTARLGMEVEEAGLAQAALAAGGTRDRPSQRVEACPRVLGTWTASALIL